MNEKPISSETLLDALLDLIPAMVWYKDANNVIIKANRLAAESINKTPAQIAGVSTFDLYPKKDAEKYHKDDLAVIKSGEPRIGIVEQYQAAGDMRWVRTDKVPYRDTSGKVVGVLVFAQDITDQKKAQESIERERKTLVELNQLMMGREERILQLKAEVDEILKKHGQRPKYSV